MLQGVRILDLTWVLGGPFAGQLLAQLGADVIKIEPPRGDLARKFPPHYIGADSAFYLSVNRGKRSLALDLQNPAAKPVLRRLVERSDAVIYGFAPDVPARLGIDLNSLRAMNPRICVGELIGLDDRGEYARAPAYDLILQAIGGFMSITGEVGGAPVRAGYQVADLVGGLYLALGLSAALLQAARRGAGQKVQLSLLDCQLAMLTWQAQNYFISGVVPRATGTRHAMVAPSEVFDCADGRFLAISPTTPEFWDNFCTAIGRPDLATDPRFADHQQRFTNVAALAQELAAVFRQQPAEHWRAELFHARVPVGRVNDVAEALEQDLAQRRAMVEQVAAPDGSTHRFLGNPFKYDGASSLRFPPVLGADSRQVLSEVGEFSAAEIDALVASGAVVCAPK
jgi:formyl-CoA transferase